MDNTKFSSWDLNTAHSNLLESHHVYFLKEEKTVLVLLFFQSTIDYL